jgi:F-type H+-transporting ATPase subunit delta
MSARDRVRDYADAFYQAAWERWLDALQTVNRQLAERPDLRARMESADLDFSQRQAVLDGLLPAGIDRPVRNLLYTLVQHDELPLLEGIVASLSERARCRESGPTEVEIVSAVPLTDEERQSLLTRLQEQQGELAVRYRVDPRILGGLIVRVGDKLIDNSVASRLTAMRQALGVKNAD